MNNLSGSIRVANIIEEGKLGGPQVRIVRVANALHGRVETTVIMPEENSEVFRTLCDKYAIQYKTFWMSRITKEWTVALRYLLFFPYELVRLVLYFKKENFDLIYVSGGSWQYKGAIAGKLAGIKVLWHLNDTSMPWLFRKIFAAFSTLADGYVYTAMRARDYYSSLVQEGKPEFVILPPVDTAKFDPSQQYSGDESLMKQWRGKIIVGTVANINPIKGLDVFIQAAAKLSDQNENLVFVVVGPIHKNQHKYYKHLQVLSDRASLKNLEFVGGRSDVRQLLQRFDVYVCSSHSETGPMTLFEAMSMEKPVVSTDVGDVPSYVSDGDNGFIIDVGDAKALAEKIAVLSLDADKRQKFGKKAREVVVNDLDIEKCAQRHLDAYTKLLSDGYSEASA